MTEDYSRKTLIEYRADTIEIFLSTADNEIDLSSFPEFKAVHDSILQALEFIYPLMSEQRKA